MRSTKFIVCFASLLFHLNILRTEEILQFWDKKFSLRSRASHRQVYFCLIVLPYFILPVVKCTYTLGGIIISPKDFDCKVTDSKDSGANSFVITTKKDISKVSMCFTCVITYFLSRVCLISNNFFFFAENYVRDIFTAKRFEPCRKQETNSASRCRLF